MFGLHSSFLCNEIKNIRQMVFFCLFHNMITTGLRPELKIGELCCYRLLVNLSELLCERNSRISPLFLHLQINTNPQSVSLCADVDTHVLVRQRLGVFALNKHASRCEYMCKQRSVLWSDGPVCGCVSGYQSCLEWHHLFLCLSYVCCFRTLSWSMEVLYVSSFR